jgi:biopolymer transport protein ExbD
MASMRKYKRFMVNPVTRPNSEINVTPLVDVVLVLLIIFMVVTPLL